MLYLGLQLVDQVFVVLEKVLHLLHRLPLNQQVKLLSNMG
ncbi:UNVERIFIED_CONTAM: hypothetical protein GTU68_021834 [Idotea baltica]|nr:hypothetical protein [Idotea baltica]